MRRATRGSPEGLDVARSATRLSRVSLWCNVSRRVRSGRREYASFFGPGRDSKVDKNQMPEAVLAVDDHVPRRDILVNYPGAVTSIQRVRQRFDEFYLE